MGGTHQGPEEEHNKKELKVGKKARRFHSQPCSLKFAATIEMLGASFESELGCRSCSLLVVAWPHHPARKNNSVRAANGISINESPVVSRGLSGIIIADTAASCSCRGNLNRSLIRGPNVDRS